MTSQLIGRDSSGIGNKEVDGRECLVGGEFAGMENSTRPVAEDIMAVPTVMEGVMGANGYRTTFGTGKAIFPS